MRRALEVVPVETGLGYRLVGGRALRRRRSEPLSALCGRLVVDEVVFPSGELWPAPLAAVVAELSDIPLPDSVVSVRVGAWRLDLSTPLGRATWRFVVSSLVGRTQLHSTDRLTGPGGGEPARVVESAFANSTTAPSDSVTTKRAGHSHGSRSAAEPAGTADIMPSSTSQA